MNYYKQGDAANADKIKAAFEAKGFIPRIAPIYYGSESVLFFTDEENYICETSSPWIINIIKTHPDYQELELPVEPLFKEGDWIVQNDNGTVSQITKTINEKDEDGEYRAYEHTNGYFAACFENEYHLWTIADAKDGDILSAKIDGDDYILIFKQIKDGWIETYGHYYITIDKFCAPTQMFCRNYQGRLYPATQEQYRTLFKKMHDDGYEWDFDKNELKKIPVKPKFKVGDLLQSGCMWAMVRRIDTENQRYVCQFDEVIPFENQDLWHLAPKKHYHLPCPKNIPCCDCHDECNSRQCVEEPKTETKVCTKCGRELPLTDYYRNKKGYRAECKHCSIERTMHQRKGEQHQVKHHIVMHGQVEQPKPRKPRVANGNGDRSDYMHQYYLEHKEKLTAKNRADQLRRAELKRAATSKAEKGCLLCANYPCFDGIENLESDFAKEGCHAFRKRENNDGTSRTF